jgi:IS1 family transposase
VNCFEYRHQNWLERRDEGQQRYECARRFALDPGAHVPEELNRMLRAHGVAGLFIDPERTILSSQPRCPGKQTTAFHHSRIGKDIFGSVACALAEGVGVNSAARIFDINKKTALKILGRAADHAASLSRSLLQGVAVRECQLDEMWSFIGKKQCNLVNAAELQAGLGDSWIWIAFDAVHKIVISHVVGKRTVPYATSLLRGVKRVTASMPLLFSSDQLDAYTGALLQVYGQPVVQPRSTKHGRPPKPQFLPPPDLRYVQVVKKYKQQRVASISRRVVFGDPERIQALLQDSAVSSTINTSHVERNNATIRHLDARCNRKTYRFSKCQRNHLRQLDLCLAYYHLCRPHKTLSAQQGRPTTPFMAAGLTDHVWSMRDILDIPLDRLRG